MNILEKAFFNQKTEVVAQQLLGKRLVRVIDGQIISGIIVETEAYGCSEDPASHSYRGKTLRTEPLFGEVGCGYIYFTYGNHFCFNAVAKDKTTRAGGVLIRALEPDKGLPLMQKHREKKNTTELTNGPGKLTQALQINKSHNFIDLTKKGELFIAEGKDIPSHQIVRSTRIGISKAQDKLWRFYVRDNKWVSR